MSTIWDDVGAGEVSSGGGAMINKSGVYKGTIKEMKMIVKPDYGTTINITFLADGYEKPNFIYLNLGGGTIEQKSAPYNKKHLGNILSLAGNYTAGSKPNTDEQGVLIDFKDKKIRLGLKVEHKFEHSGQEWTKMGVYIDCAYDYETGKAYWELKANKPAARIESPITTKQNFQQALDVARKNGWVCGPDIKNGVPNKDADIGDDIPF